MAFVIVTGKHQSILGINTQSITTQNGHRGTAAVGVQFLWIETTHDQFHEITRLFAIIESEIHREHFGPKAQNRYNRIRDHREHFGSKTQIHREHLAKGHESLYQKTR